MLYLDRRSLQPNEEIPTLTPKSFVVQVQRWYPVDSRDDKGQLIWDVNLDGCDFVDYNLATLGRLGGLPGNYFNIDGHTTHVMIVPTGLLFRYDTEEGCALAAKALERVKAEKFVRDAINEINECRQVMYHRYQAALKAEQDKKAAQTYPEHPTGEPQHTMDPDRVWWNPFTW